MPSGGQGLWIPIALTFAFPMGLLVEWRGFN